MSIYLLGTHDTVLSAALYMTFLVYCY